MLLPAVADAEKRQEGVTSGRGPGRERGVSKRITTLVPWYGSNRTLAENVGAALKGCSWVGVPFAGGMCELGHIEARTRTKRVDRAVRYLMRRIRREIEAKVGKF